MAKNDHQGSFSDREWQLLRVIRCLDTREYLLLVAAIYSYPVALGYLPRIIANGFYIGRPERERDIRLKIMARAYGWIEIVDGEGESARDGWFVVSPIMLIIVILWGRGLVPSWGVGCYEGTFSD